MWSAISFVHGLDVKIRSKGTSRLVHPLGWGAAAVISLKFSMALAATF